MGEASLLRGRVFGCIPSSCLEAYRSLLKFYLRRCVGLARAHGANSHQVTNAVQDLELITLAVARRLYQGGEVTPQYITSYSRSSPILEK